MLFGGGCTFPSYQLSAWEGRGGRGRFFSLFLRSLLFFFFASCSLSPPLPLPLLPSVASSRARRSSSSHTHPRALTSSPSRLSPFPATLSPPPSTLLFAHYPTRATPSSLSILSSAPHASLPLLFSSIPSISIRSGTNSTRPARPSLPSLPVPRLAAAMQALQHPLTPLLLEDTAPAPPSRLG